MVGLDEDLNSLFVDKLVSLKAGDAFSPRDVCGVSLSLVLSPSGNYVLELFLVIKVAISDPFD
jgi:hypothetical protein